MSSKIKVLHIITRLIVGGAQENTMLTIAGLNDLGYAAELLSGPTTGPEGEIVTEVIGKGIELSITPNLVRNINPIKDLRAFFDIYHFIKAGKYQIVHTHSSKAGILGRLAAYFAGVPVIVHTIHGLPYHPFQNPLINLFYIIAEKIAGYVSDSIIAVSSNNAESAISKHIAPRFKFSVIRSGMKIARFQAAAVKSADMRKRLGISKETKVLGVIARLFHLKGHKYLIRIAPNILKKYPDVKFLFVGDGILRERLETLTTSLGVRDRFIFAGLIPRDQVPDYISAMDIIVHPSLREGLARVIPQGFIMEKPVVIFDIDGANELVKSYKTGMLVEPRDTGALETAILYLLDNPANAAEMVSRGKDIAITQFTEDKMVSDINKVYQKLIKRR